MKCKYCGNEITKVLNIQSGTAAWLLDKNGNYEQHRNFFEVDGEQNDFCCPECLKPIFDGQDEAIEGLNKKDKK